MSEDMEDYECSECDFRFNVIWNYDATQQAFPVRAVNYCPRCGASLDDEIPEVWN